MNEDIKKYNTGLSGNDKVIAEILRKKFSEALPDATAKVWHGSPVWFLDGNPIVTYVRRKTGMCVMFWSGQSFDESGLSAEGSFEAAQILYDDTSDINFDDLRRWLEKSRHIQWDYKNIVKNKGLISRIQ